MGDDFDFRALLRQRRAGHSPKFVSFGGRKPRKGKYATGWMLVGGLLLGATAATVGLHWSGGAPPPSTSPSRDVVGTYDVVELEARKRNAQREAEDARRRA
jgi:hypothetical protein